MGKQTIITCDGCGINITGCENSFSVYHSDVGEYYAKTVHAYMCEGCLDNYMEIFSPITHITQKEEGK